MGRIKKEELRIKKPEMRRGAGEIILGDYPFNAGIGQNLKNARAKSPSRKKMTPCLADATPLCASASLREKPLLQNFREAKG